MARFNVLHKAMGQSYRQVLDTFRDSGFDIDVGDRAMDGIDREPAILLREAGAKITEQTTAAIALKGGAVMGQVVETMAGIAASSREIAAISGVIDDLVSRPTSSR